VLPVKGDTSVSIDRTLFKVGWGWQEVIQGVTVVKREGKSKIKKRGQEEIQLFERVSCAR